MSKSVKDLLKEKYGIIATIKRVDGNFNCSYKNLTSLEGCPEEIDGSFYCFNNNLTSLKGAPEKVGGNFDCFNNQLTSLKGAPEKVGGNFNCLNNKKQFTREEVKEVCNVKGRIYV